MNIERVEEALRKENSLKYVWSAADTGKHKMSLLKNRNKETTKCNDIREIIVMTIRFENKKILPLVFQGQ